jgi:hypothetical protein
MFLALLFTLNLFMHLVVVVPDLERNKNEQQHKNKLKKLEEKAVQAEKGKEAHKKVTIDVIDEVCKMKQTTTMLK